MDADRGNGGTEDGKRVFEAFFSQEGVEAGMVERTFRKVANTHGQLLIIDMDEGAWR